MQPLLYPRVSSQIFIVTSFGLCTLHPIYSHSPEGSAPSCNFDLEGAILPPQNMRPRYASYKLTGNFPLESHAECDETRRINERARSAYRSTRYSASLPQIQLRYRAISLAFRGYRCSHATSPKVLIIFSISLIFLFSE